MGGILSSLNTSYTGLQAHQSMVDVTGNNISNASDEFYSRQRVIAKPQNAYIYGGQNANMGVDVQAIERVHDEFVFSRYTKANYENTYYDTEFSHLQEASAYFPDIDEASIFTDLQDYFNSWKELSKNAKDSAQKQALAQKTEALTNSIKDTRERLTTLQHKASEELKSVIKEVNNLGSQIADINKRMKEVENNRSLKHANELRDKRDELEFHLRELLGGNVFKSSIRTSSLVDKNSADFDEGYTLNVGRGFNIIDGTIFHPLVIRESENKGSLNQVYFQGDDFKEVNITDRLNQGKAGALLGVYNDGSNGTLKGKLQNYIDLLDSFAKGLIESSNAIYAQSASHNIESEPLEFNDNEAFKDTNYNIKDGSFDLVAYNTDGKEIARKTIKITPITTMKDIIQAINANTDDNHDNNTENDFDDYFTASFNNQTKRFIIQPKNASQGLFVSLKDNGTNFTGALKLNPFFQGDDASNISLNKQYKKEPTAIRPWLTPINGNFDVANMMQQLQYDNVDFYNNKFDIKQMKISEFYQFLTGKVNTDAEKSGRILDTKKSVLETIKKEQLSISQVSVDEEMVNLIKFQSGYAANAKVITAIDKMIDTLLGIKQ
ncbi:flagellar hook-associated protein FlgK [Helicobacter cetorum]|uniref:Flagellar hook-associated protein 1 n=1 Tax=Helicobacter cetorum (strain ATCC BAA-429 / MIT 00-7128) TaxID=182217 RepID=I0EPQ6_HELC0|nr:flagellar hook-associated protein FlgK [Helicobacter cetorum]AFI04925.1 flagellar hook-associated protein FlgK [Helicobacter cetorum MIT 00-7128]